MQDIGEHGRRVVEEEGVLLTVSLVSNIVDTVRVRRATVVLLKLLNDELDHALFNEYGHKVGLDRDLLKTADAEA